MGYTENFLIFIRDEFRRIGYEINTYRGNDRAIKIFSKNNIAIDINFIQAGVKLDIPSHGNVNEFVEKIRTYVERNYPGRILPTKINNVMISISLRKNAESDYAYIFSESKKLLNFLEDDKDIHRLVREFFVQNQ